MTGIPKSKIIESKTNPILTNNLNYLIQLSTKSVKAVSTDLNIGYSTYCKWLNGNSQPRAASIVKIAEYFNVSADALKTECLNTDSSMSRKDYQLLNAANQDKKNMILAMNLEQLLEISNKTRKDLCLNIEMAFSSVSRWFTGEAYPNNQAIQRIATYFEVSVAQIVDIQPTKTIEDYEVDFEINHMEKKRKHADPEFQNKLAAFANNLSRQLTIKNKTKEDLAAELELGGRTIHRWVSGSYYPSTANIEKLTRYFNISESQLLEPSEGVVGLDEV